MTRETLISLFVVLAALAIVHFMVHIDLDKPPDHVILALEVGVMTLIFAAIMWDHILAILKPSTEPRHHLGPEMINSIVIAFVASVLLYVAVLITLRVLDI